MKRYLSQTPEFAAAVARRSAEATITVHAWQVPLVE